MDGAPQTSGPNSWGQRTGPFGGKGAAGVITLGLWDEDTLGHPCGRPGVPAGHRGGQAMRSQRQSLG